VRRLQGAEPEQEQKQKAKVVHDEDPDVKRLESNLVDKLGAQVKIEQRAGGKGKLVISYNTLDELEGILEHIQ